MLKESLLTKIKIFGIDSVDLIRFLPIEEYFWNNLVQIGLIIKSNLEHVERHFILQQLKHCNALEKLWIIGSIPPTFKELFSVFLNKFKYLYLYNND